MAAAAPAKQSHKPRNLNPAFRTLPTHRRQATYDSDSSRFEGYIFKLGKFLNNWTPVYAVLMKDELLYFKDRAQSGEPKRIRLLAAKLQRATDDKFGKPFVFTLQPFNSKRRCVCFSVSRSVCVSLCV